MTQPYDPNVVSDIIAEAINQVIRLTAKDSVGYLSPKMRGILDEAVKHCLATNRRTLINVRDHILTLKGDGPTRDGIIQRLNFLLSDDRLNAIICGRDAIEWGKLIHDGDTLIVDCSQMSADKMVFLGNIVSQGLKNYFRYAKPAIYKPLALYVDECQNSVNTNFFDILKEGRKYKLSAILATQDLSSIDEKLVQIMLNVGNIVAFRVGHRDAQKIANEMDITATELQFVEKYHFHYLTPEGRGIAKAYPKPFIKQKTIVTAAGTATTAPQPFSTPNSTTTMTKPKTPTITWFPLLPYHPDETSTSPAVPVEALKMRAKTTLSATTDG